MIRSVRGLIGDRLTCKVAFTVRGVTREARGE